MYPKLKATAFVKKFEHCVIVGEHLSGKDSHLMPIGGYILSLCNGTVDETTIARCLANTFGSSESDAQVKVRGTLSHLSRFVDWYDEPQSCEMRYNMEDFIYKTTPLNSFGVYSSPFFAQLVLTNNCNFHCIYCFNSSQEKQEGSMDGKNWLDVARQLVEMDIPFIDITGGEPLVMPFLPEMLAYLSDNNRFVTLFTNGSLIDEAFAKFLSQLKNICVQVSLDSANAELHHLMTNSQNTFDSVISAVKLLVNKQIPTRIKAVLLPNSYLGIPHLVKLCADLGVYALTLDTYDYCSTGRGEAAYALNDEQSADAKAITQAACDSLSRDMVLSYQRGRKVWAKAEDIIYCGAFTSGFCLLSNGEYTLCEKTSGNIDCKVGFFPDMSIRQMWERVKKQHPLDFPASAFTKTCKDCTLFELCRGGCPALRIGCPTPYPPDSRCSIVNEKK